MSESRSARHVLRIPPCPAYDVDGMESWLTDLAAKGLMLREDGFFMGVASFERTQPSAEVRYRLDAAPNKGGIFADNYGEPEAEVREISRDMGWEYVARRGDFYIYRSASPEVRELNTDPQVQALAIETVHKRCRSSLIGTLLWWIIYSVAVGRSTLLNMSVRIGTWFFVFGLLLGLWLILASAAQTVYLGRLCRRLKDGEGIDHNKEWQKRALRHRVSLILRVVLVTVWLCMLLPRMIGMASDKGSISLEQYSGEPPFATIADFAPEGEYALESMFGLSNTVKEWSDWLAPVNMEWNEIACVTLPDGSKLSGSLDADYHDTVSPVIAKLMAREYIRADYGRKRFKLLDVTVPEADFARVYNNSIGFPTAVIVIGNKVLHARFYQYQSSDCTVPLESWVNILADSLR